MNFNIYVLYDKKMHMYNLPTPIIDDYNAVMALNSTINHENEKREEKIADSDLVLLRIASFDIKTGVMVVHDKPVVVREDNGQVVSRFLDDGEIEVMKGEVKDEF